MDLSTFKVDVDVSNGHKFVFQAKGEFDKYHGIDQKDIPNQGRLYENKSKIIGPQGQRMG